MIIWIYCMFLGKTMYAGVICVVIVLEEELVRELVNHTQVMFVLYAYPHWWINCLNSSYVSWHQISVQSLVMSMFWNKIMNSFQRSTDLCYVKTVLYKRDIEGWKAQEKRNKENKFNFKPYKTLTMYIWCNEI